MKVVSGVSAMPSLSELPSDTELDLKRPLTMRIAQDSYCEVSPSAVEMNKATGEPCQVGRLASYMYPHGRSVDAAL